MSELAKKKCIPCSGDIPALKDDEITELKKELNELTEAGLSLPAASKYLAKKNNLTKNFIYNLK